MLIETETRSAPVSELRTRILAEATRLFARKGYSATSVREVVEASGCTKPALYYYFRSKDALFLEALREGTDTITRIIEESVTTASVRDAMRVGLQSFLDHIHDHPMEMRLLMRAELQPDEGQPKFDFESLRARHLDLIKQVLLAGVDSGEIRKDVDLEDAAWAIGGMVDQRMQLWLLGTPLPKDLPGRLLDIFFRGVGVGA